MAQSPTEPAPSLAFPSWPFSCLDFYSRAIRDYGRYSDAVAHVTDAAQTLRAEGDLRLQLWQDAVRAWFDLAVLPMTLMANAAASAEAAEPGQAERTAAE